MSSRFSTLILREWMQHKRGWLITLLLPPLLFLAILPFGQVEGLPVREHPLPIAVLITMITTLAVLGITYVGALFQLPGLARRDQQDRSIEFWLSLPASHSESIGATMLTHALLVPLVALPVGFVFGLVISPSLIAKEAGMAGLSSVPWLSVLAAGVPALLRALFGVLLMSLWLAPLMLIVMVASAWLKRWGVPAVAIAVGVGGAILDKVYGYRIVWDLLGAQLEGAGRSLVADADLLRDHVQMAETTGAVFKVGSWAVQDALSAVQLLASPHLIGGLIVAAGCFYLLVLKRSRSN